MLLKRVSKALKAMLRSGRARAKAKAAPRRRARPALEGLGERIVPAVNTWIYGGWGASTWSNGANWSQGSPPDSTDDIVFDGGVANTGAGYYGTGGAIGKSISFVNGYDQQLTIYSSGAVTLDALSFDSQATLYMSGPGKITVQDLSMVGGSITAPSGYPNTVEIADIGEINTLSSGWNVYTQSHLKVLSGAQLNLDLTSFTLGDYLSLGNGADIINQGTVLHAGGEVVGWSGPTDNHFVNEGVYRKTGTGTATLGSVSLMNNHNNGEVRVEQGTLNVAYMQQTAGLAGTKIYAGATLDIDNNSGFAAGTLYTWGTGAAFLVCPNFTLSGTAKLDLAGDDSTSCGELIHTGTSFTFADQATFKVTIHGDGSASDSLQSNGTVDLTEECELEVSVWGSLAGGLSWRLIEAGTLSGGFWDWTVPAGLSLDTANGADDFFDLIS
jgi:hypothetical protein